MGGVVKSVGNAFGFGDGTFFDGKRGVTEDPAAAAAFGIAKPTLQLTNDNTRNLINEYFANPSFQGQRVAGLNPFQTQGANSVGNFANNFFNSANAATDASLGMVNSGAGYGMNAQNLFNQYAGMDPTQQILGTAAQYANNPYIDGMIDASGRDVTRQLSEQTLPTLNRQFSGTGNTNSTRAGVQAAIAERGAADRLADMSSNIRGQFFGKGLEQGQSQFNQNLQNSLSANSQLLNSFNSGINGLNSGQNLASGYFDQLNAAGGMFQNQNQRELDANKATYDEALANRLAVLGAGNNAVSAAQGFKSSAGTYQDKSGAEKLGGVLKLGGQIAGMF